MDINAIIHLAGALVPLFSAVSSFVNHVVRQMQANGKTVPPFIAGASSVLNVGALNIDKAVQMAQLVKAMSAKPADAEAQVEPEVVINKPE